MSIDRARRESHGQGVIGSGAAVAAQDGPLHDGSAATSRLEGQVIDDQQHPVAAAQVRLEPGARTATSQLDGSFAFDHVAYRGYRLSASFGDSYSEIASLHFSDTSEPATLRMRRGMAVVLHVLAKHAPCVDAEISVDAAVTLRSGSDGTARFTALSPGLHSFVVTAADYAATTVSVHLDDDPGASIERTIELRTGAAVGGSVIGPDGNHVADANIYFTSVDFSDVEAAKTDDHGVWHLDSLAAGRYQITADSIVYGPDKPIAIDLDGVTPRSDIIIRVAYDAQLVGTVVDAAGLPVAAATVVMTRTGEPVGFEQTTDTRGHFELLGEPAAEYRVVARKGKQASPVLQVALANDTRTEVQLDVQYSSIEGTVVDSNAEPIADAHVAAQPVPPRFGGGVIEDTTDSRGQFSLDALEPGAYLVSATWPGQDAQQTREGERVMTGTSNLKLELPSVATLTGRVLLDGKPVPYYGVLVTENPEWSFIGDPIAVRSADGRFAVRAIEPGTWGLVVLGPGTGRMIRTDIAITAGKTVDLGDIAMSHGQRITGYVRDATGAPVAGAQVQIGIPRGGDSNSLGNAFASDYGALTDATGAYVFDGIAPLPTANIRATAPGRGGSPAASVPVGDATIDLVLAASGGVDGHLVGFTGIFASIEARRLPEATDPHSARVDALGEFRFDDLPAGEYVFSMGPLPGDPSAQPVRGTVVANQRTAVTLVMPTTTVTVEIHTSGAACDVLSLNRPGPDVGDPTVGVADCHDNTAEIEAVAPGPYRVCVGERCVDVTVADHPPKQTLEVRFAR